MDLREFFEGVTMIMKGPDPALGKDLVATYLRVTALYKAQASLQGELAEVRDEGRQGRSALADHLAQLATSVQEARCKNQRALARIQQQLDRAFVSAPVTG